MSRITDLDRQHVWHPFTQMRDWLRTEPVVIARGRGAVLWDTKGRKYLDANSSIWTNLHGHGNARINAAVRGQLTRIAHSSALGLANEPAARLAQQLVAAANPKRLKPALRKVFFSDDGSTAMEVALKLAYEFSRRTGRTRPRFLSLQGAYHGDTVGAVALGHIDLFHKAYAGLLFKTDEVMAPYCYRCPFNRARPERADAREYRRCSWECLGQLEGKFDRARKKRASYAAFVFEPLMQGAAGMIPQPAGWLARAAAIARRHSALLVADEVMTGFGRAASALPPQVGAFAGVPALFACHQESVQPDFMALAKGLTGGYLPMAATLTTQAVFDAFLGDYGEFKTFFHGHSFTGNQLGAAAALASLGLLRQAACRRNRARLERTLESALAPLWRHPNVGDIRRVGLAVGVELVSDWRSREPFDLRDQAGIRVCRAMARRGVLTRPIGNVVVLMPPYCTTDDQAQEMVAALAQALSAELAKARTV